MNQRDCGRLGHGSAAAPILAAGALALLGSFLRFVAVPPLVGDVDSVNFARSLVAFDPTQQAPHFPGYPVFVLVARAWREIGILSDVWALTLGAIFLWPAAALLLFFGVRRVFGEWPAFGALVAASLAPAAVVAGGWPASDGLGLTLLCAGAGALGLARSSSENRGWPLPLALGGLLLGLTLGVRLSWCPVVVTVLIVFVWAGNACADTSGRRRLGVQVIAATTLGILAWLAPLAAFVGPTRLFHLAFGFVGGHFSTWGGTAFDDGGALIARVARAAWAVWAAGLGAAWPFAVPMSDRTAPSSGVGLLLALLCVAAAIGLVGAAGKRGGWTKAGWLLLAVAPYFVWVVGFQNVAKTRHLVPLLPVVGALLFVGLRALPQRRVLACVFTALLVTVSVGNASVQGSEPVPAVAMVRWVLQTRAPQPVQIFAGEEARLFEHFAPALRVLRPTDGEILATEAQRVAALGVEVWVSSGTPGVTAIERHLSPIAEFGFPMRIRAHDSQLTLYRFVPEPRSTVISMNGARL